MGNITLPDVKGANDLACSQTLDAIELAIPEADEKQTHAMFDWLKAFMEVRRVREFWGKASRTLRRAEMRWGELHPPRQGERTDLTSSREDEVEVANMQASEFREMADNRWLLFLQNGGQAKDSPSQSPSGLFGHEIEYLREHEHHRHKNHGRDGMVYWEMGVLKRFSEINELY